MKITIKDLPLKKKTYEVKQTVKNLRKTYKLQLTFARSADIESMDDTQVIESFVDVIEDAESYIKEVLKLTDKQTETLEDLTQDELLTIANEISMQLMGIEPEAKSDKKK